MKSSKLNFFFLFLPWLSLGHRSRKGLEQEQGMVQETATGHWLLGLGLGLALGFLHFFWAWGVRFYILWAICTFLRSALFAVVEATSAFFTFLFPFLSLSLSFLFYFTAYVCVCVCTACGCVLIVVSLSLLFIAFQIKVERAACK